MSLFHGFNQVYWVEYYRFGDNKKPKTKGKTQAGNHGLPGSIGDTSRCSLIRENYVTLLMKIFHLAK